METVYTVISVTDGRIYLIESFESLIEASQRFEVRRPVASPPVAPSDLDGFTSGVIKHVGWTSFGGDNELYLIKQKPQKDLSLCSVCGESFCGVH